MNANLAVSDGIDGEIDWPLQPDRTRPLTELYLGDYQVVDVAKPYYEDSYLEIPKPSGSNPPGGESRRADRREHEHADARLRSPHRVVGRSAWRRALHA